MSLFLPESDWCCPTELPDWRGAKIMGVDTETKDTGLQQGNGPGWPWKGGNIVGYCLAVEDRSIYVPVAHERGQNYPDPDQVRRWFSDHMATDADKVFHTAMYDLGWLGTEGIKVSGKKHDVAFAAALLDETRFSYSLDSLGDWYIKEKKNEDLLDQAAAYFKVRKPKENLWNFPPEFVGPYGEQDPGMTLRLWTNKLEGLLAEQDLTQVYEMEIRLIDMLVEMRRRGVRVDIGQAERARDWLDGKVTELKGELRRRVGFDVEVWSAASIAKAFDAENLTYPRTSVNEETGRGGAPSFKAPWLDSHPHWLPQMILEIRKYDNAGGSYVQNMILDHAVNGRIHAEAHPLKSDRGGTGYGRFAYTDPNLQQVPSPDKAKDLQAEIGRAIRGCFKPEEGMLWGSHDYSQQEPRLTVHYAALMKLRGYEEALAYYNNDPDADFHQMVAEMASIPRKTAKPINLGLAYGKGKKALARELGLTQEEGDALFELYHSKVPFVGALSETCSNVARDRGFIRTMGGRRARFDLWEPSGKYGQGAHPHWKAKQLWPNQPLRRAYTYRAMNRLIQGSAADMTKKAMLDLWDEGIVPMLQVHDELAFSVESEAQGDRAKQIMIDAVKLKVPVKVDAEYGPSWGEAKMSYKEALNVKS